MKETWLFLSGCFMPLINDFPKSRVEYVFLNPVDGSDEMTWKIRQKQQSPFFGSTAERNIDIL